MLAWQKKPTTIELCVFPKGGIVHLPLEFQKFFVR